MEKYEKYGLPKLTKKLKMPTLHYRRLRGNMIEVYEIINGIYDHKVVTGFFELSDGFLDILLHYC